MTAPSDSQRPSQVQITVFRSAGGRRPQGGGAVVLPVAVVAVALVLVFGAGGGSRTASATVADPGPAGVAAAYGYPTSCLRVRLSLDRAFARADFDFDRPTSCGLYSGFPTAIFRRAGGEWHPMLYTVSIPCPVPSVPRTAQRQLTLCR